MRRLFSLRRTYICLLICFSYILFLIHAYFPPSLVLVLRDADSAPKPYAALSPTRHTHVKTIVWSHNGTGLIKYIQWILTRKLANVRLTHLDETCCISDETHVSTDPTDQTFVQVYIVSFNSRSACAVQLRDNATHIDHVYFKRKSIAASVVFDFLDRQSSVSALNRTSLQTAVDRAAQLTKSLSESPLGKGAVRWKTINAEDLIHPNLIECEQALTALLALFKPTATAKALKDVIEYDSHRFTTDATWWDRSDVAERLLNGSIPARPSQFTYTDDFYYLHGTRSFVQYLADNRRCAKDGTFAQRQSETLPKRISTDSIDRCSSNPFDCAFSDIYSFSDREQLYAQSPYQPLKCGFAVPSIFDKARLRYGRNQTCETIFMTSIINCYDPIPNTNTNGNIPSSICFVALVDSKTARALRGRYPAQAKPHWDLIDLSENAAVFNFPAKTIETLKIVGQRMFPLAKWIIWLDGKAHLMNYIDVLMKTSASILGARHSEFDRTSATEVFYTVERIRDREGNMTASFNRSAMDIRRQEKEYQRDGFYARSGELHPKMFDIALFMYRNNHPCNFRNLCGWHNEVNYYSYRGQLSVYYAAVRLNITSHFGIIPRSHYHTYAHVHVC